MDGYTGLTNLYVPGKTYMPGEVKVGVLLTPGVPVLAKLGAVAFDSAESGTAVKVGSVPAGAEIIRAVCVVKTAFNAVTTNVLIVGTEDDDDALMGSDDITEGTAGAYSKQTFLETGDAALDIYAKYTQTGDAATAGKAEIWVEYVRLAI